MYRYLPGYWEGVPLTNSSNNYGQIRPSREAWDEHNDRYPGDWREECTYLDYKYKCNTTVENENYRGKQYYIYPYTKENYPDQSTSKYEYLPYLRKWVDPTFTAGNANVNFIVYRYADLLLTLAEAANELGGAHTRKPWVMSTKCSSGPGTPRTSSVRNPPIGTQACRRRRYAPPCASSAAAN